MTLLLREFNESLPSYARYGLHIYVQDGVHFPTKLTGIGEFSWGVPKPAVEFSAAEGGAGSVAKGTYKIHVVGYSSYFDAKGMPYSNTPVSVDISADDKSINLTGLPIFNDPQVDRVQVYRTTVDTTGPFYYAGYVWNGTTTLTLNGADSSLPSTDFLEPPGTGTIKDSFLDFAGPFKYEKPPVKRFAVAWDGRIFCAGEHGYAVGSVSLTDGSTTVTGGSTNWTSAMKGKFFQADGESVRYEISDVTNEDILILARPYLRPEFRLTDPTDAGYQIIGNEFELVWSEIDEPDHFGDGVSNSMFVGQDEGSGITGLKVYQEQLLVFTAKAVHAVYRSGNPLLPYGVRRTDSPVGCVAPRSVIAALGRCWWYSGDGFYRLTGTTAERFSDPLGDLQTNMYADIFPFIVGSYCNGRLYWATAYNQPNYHDTILTYDIEKGFWDLPMENLRVIDMAGIIEDGRQRVYFVEWGPNQYWVNQFNHDWTNDGAGDTTDLFGTVDSASNFSLVDADAGFNTVGPGLEGCRVYIREGTGVGEENWVESNTVDTLYLEEPWATIPDSTSKYVVASIDMDLYARDETAQRPQTKKTFKHLELVLAE